MLIPTEEQVAQVTALFAERGPYGQPKRSDTPATCFGHIFVVLTDATIAVVWFDYTYAARAPSIKRPCPDQIITSKAAPARARPCVVSRPPLLRPGGRWSLRVV